MAEQSEIICFVDSKSWIWQFIQQALTKIAKTPLRLPAQYGLYRSWARVKGAPFIIIHWECKERGGGAAIEEIRAIDPNYPVFHQVIVICTNPTHEDIIYLSELAVSKVMTVQNNPMSLAKGERELAGFLTPNPAAQTVLADHKLSIERLTAPLAATPPALVKALQININKALAKAGAGNNSARTLDLAACLSYLSGDSPRAEELWHQALDKNPNYFRASNNLAHFYRLAGRFDDAFSLLKKLQQRNKGNIARLVAMGELQVKLANDDHAIHYFNSALVRDRYCSSALNGLAEIYFRRGDLDKARDCLSRSHIAGTIAAKLNSDGIALVKEGRFEEALEHYIKAQYVLPQQEKSPMLFYNIGLCYSRWGKNSSAKQYLEIALIKEPGYEKAQKLLAAITRIEDLQRG